MLVHAPRRHRCDEPERMALSDRDVLLDRGPADLRGDAEELGREGRSWIAEMNAASSRLPEAWAIVTWKSRS